jgi:hypothetical protein
LMTRIYLGLRRDCSGKETGAKPTKFASTSSHSTSVDSSGALHLTTSRPIGALRIRR